MSAIPSPRLAKAGWRIRVAVRRPNSAHFLKPTGRVGQIQIVKADIRDDASVEATMRGADAAVNLVGILAESGKQRFETIHVEGAARIARVAAAHGVARLVHVSAMGVSAEAPARYGRSKATGETRVRDFFPAVTVLRPSLVFGPEDDFFNKFAWLARLSPVLPLIGCGHTRFQPVYVGDVANAVAMVLSDADTAGKSYELAGPEVMSFADIMRTVLRETHRKRILLSIPFALARFMAAFLGLLPKPLLTHDQVRMLEADSLPSEGAPGLRDLGITPAGTDAILPSYLWRFRKHGEFEVMRS